MNDKQKRFVSEYLIDQNATQAAIRSGYSTRSAYSQGQRLLKNDEVKSAIDAGFERIREKNVASAEEVEMYLTKVMRGESMSETIVVEGTGKGYSKAVRIGKRPDEKDRLRAAELLGKRYGIFKDKLELDADDMELTVRIDYGNQSASE